MFGPWPGTPQITPGTPGSLGVALSAVTNAGTLGPAASVTFTSAQVNKQKTGNYLVTGYVCFTASAAATAQISGLFNGSNQNIVSMTVTAGTTYYVPVTFVVSGAAASNNYGINVQVTVGTATIIAGSALHNITEF